MEDSSNDVVFWYYQSDVDAWPATVTGDSTPRKWNKYRDIEMDIIEEAHQQGRSFVILDRYRIDLGNFIQIRLGDDMKQRPIKREIGSNRLECLRQDRFCLTPAVLSEVPSSSSYGTTDSWCPFLRAWLNSSVGKRAWFHFPSCIEACAEGIIREARLHDNNSNAEAAYMAEKIRQCSGPSRQEASKLCINFFTKDSFLYNVLNRALREFDVTKLDTLGPLAFLLKDYSRTSKEFIGTVYRGMQLKCADIDEYKQAKGMWKTWPAYSSTSKDRAMAEMFGNTLFIVEIADTKLCAPRSFDIGSLSNFPYEQEVLLPAGLCFQIVSVHQDLLQKYIIYLKA